eukprot:TRINITY_DN22473_c0_g1_i1.p1 TRINITY_DN22473_c0_g1~~TRINITY_DN22473_c0_g1_i1.p1  ORF type:complete len:537 (+),score=95.68 TRINITY_DN22473_c0_g1_i1:45-1613(+)
MILGALATAALGAIYGSKPHIIVLYADNLGWANVDWHRPPNLNPGEFTTPNLKWLADNGIKLDRHYTYKFCSPSRSSLLTGRLPVHVNIYNDNPTMPGAGIPDNMTLISEKLNSAGYISHFIGKWHVGMASKKTKTPEARGFKTGLGYFHSNNNYYTSVRQQGCNNTEAVDLWDTGSHSTANGTKYQEQIFADRANHILANHDVHTPLFLYFAFHTSAWGWDPAKQGADLQPEQSYYEKYAFVDDPDRRKNNAMVSFMDDAIGTMLEILMQRGMYENTLIMWSSDNGGAVHLGGGANVWPLRGGYLNNWEGGVRAAALLSGGFLERVGVKPGGTLEGFIHECDWWATFCYAAGVSPDDSKAAANNLPGIDSHNMWDLITGKNTTSPRYEWSLTPLGESLSRSSDGGDAAYMSEGRYKLIVGKIRQAGWCGQIHPNTTQPWDSMKDILECPYLDNKPGCLFDILADPNEHEDLATKMPEKAREIYAKMLAAEKEWFNPNRGKADDPRACAIAQSSGYWQPYLD